MSEEHSTVKISNKDLIAVHNSMLEGLSQLSEYLGLSKVMGQLYGVLFLSDEPLSLDDIVDRLSISKANVSMNIRTLEHMGMVRQVWLHGKNGRRKYYEAETDFLQIISNIVSSREMRDLDRALTVMKDSIDRLANSADTMNEVERQIAEVYIERISQMQTLFQLAQILIVSLLSRIEELDLTDLSKIEIK